MRREANFGSELGHLHENQVGSYLHAKSQHSVLPCVIVLTIAAANRGHQVLVKNPLENYTDAIGLLCPFSEREDGSTGPQTIYLPGALSFAELAAIFLAPDGPDYLATHAPLGSPTRT